MLKDGQAMRQSGRERERERWIGSNWRQTIMERARGKRERERWIGSNWRQTIMELSLIHI